MDRARCDRAALPALLHGPHGAEPGGAAPERGSAADELAAVVDRRHLRVPDRRLADHDGHARRPDRPPATASDRRGRLRCRLDPRCILHQRGDAHCGARPARGRQRNARPLHAFPDSQHVPRSGGAHGRHRRLDRQLFRRWRRWTAAGRASARTLLVGFGLPGERPGDAAPARARTGAAAGVPRSGRGAARRHQRGALAPRRAGDDLRHQADRRGWPGVALLAGHPGGPRRRRPVRSAAEQARRPADRSRALPIRSLQRRAGGQSAGILRGIRNLSLHRPISAARSGDGPARSRSVDGAVGGRFHRRLATGPDDRAPNASGLS